MVKSRMKARQVVASVSKDIDQWLRSRVRQCRGESEATAAQPAAAAVAAAAWAGSSFLAISISSDQSSPAEASVVESEGIRSAAPTEPPLYFLVATGELGSELA